MWLSSILSNYCPPATSRCLMKMMHELRSCCSPQAVALRYPYKHTLPNVLTSNVIFFFLGNQFAVLCATPVYNNSGRILWFVCIHARLPGQNRVKLHLISPCGESLLRRGIRSPLQWFQWIHDAYSSDISGPLSIGLSNAQYS